MDRDFGYHPRGKGMKEMMNHVKMRMEKVFQKLDQWDKKVTGNYYRFHIHNF